MKPPGTGAMAWQRALVAAIKPVLAGAPPEIQGAALAELLAVFLAGHHPDLRAEILALHVDAVRRLIGPCEGEIFATRPRPAGWPPVGEPGK